MNEQCQQKYHKSCGYCVAGRRTSVYHCIDQKPSQGNQETEVLTGANTDPQNPSTAGMNKPND